MNAHKVVVIRNYDDPTLAHIDAGVLKTHGIECALHGDYSNSVLYRIPGAPPILSSRDSVRKYSLFPITLSVLDSNLQQAMEVLGIEPNTHKEEPLVEEPKTFVGRFWLFLKILVQTTIGNAKELKSVNDRQPE